MKIVNKNINDEYILEKTFKDLSQNKLWLNWEKRLSDEDKKYLFEKFSDSDCLKECLLRLRFNVNVRPKCQICGTGRVKFVNNIKNFYSKCCSANCAAHVGFDKADRQKQRKNAKLTMLERYGVEYALQNKKSLEKQKETCKKKYGVDNYTKTTEYKKQVKETCLERYGVEYSLQSKEIKEKSKQTCLHKYGVDNIAKSDIFKLKYKETCLNKYGVNCTLNAPEVKQKTLKTLQTKYGVTNPMSIPSVKEKFNTTLLERQKKEYETKKKNGTFNSSQLEKDTFEILKSKFPDTLVQYRDERYPFNCDFYIPNLDLFIECQYSWTHGGHPYNKENDKEKLELWESKNTQYYKNAINTWTVRDVKKRETAKQNNINYLEFFNIKEFNEWFENQ